MLTKDDLKMIRETMEDVIENSPRINRIEERLASVEEFCKSADERLASLEDSFNRFRITIENEALPLLREVAAAYSGSDVIFQKRAESLDEMSREMDIHSQMIKSQG